MTADHAGTVLYILWIILTNYWHTAKSGAPRYDGNDVFLSSCTHEDEVAPKGNSSGYITTDTQLVSNECTWCSVQLRMKCHLLKAIYVIASIQD